MSVFSKFIIANKNILRIAIIAVTIIGCVGSIYTNVSNSHLLFFGLIFVCFALLGALNDAEIAFKNSKGLEIIKNKIHIEIGSSDKLTNEGWSLSSSIDEISRNVELGAHVGIIGRPACGKSTIIGWLSDDPLYLCDEVSNTRGIDIYKLKVNGKDVIVRDTDGLFQILDAEDVDFRHDIITNIIKESCSHLIVVFDSITTHDHPLLDDIFGLILNSNTIGGVTICHNVKSITSIELLRDYAKHLCKYFQMSLDENLCARQEIKMNNRTKLVNHIFLCDIFEAEPSHKMEQIRQLKALVAAGANESKIDLKSVLHNSICSTLIQKCENADEKQLSFTDLNRIKYDGTLKRKHGTVVRNVINRAIEVAATKDNEIIKNKVHIEIGTPKTLTNEGWSLSSNIDEISHNLQSGIHVGVIGKPASGKSALIGWLSDDPLYLCDEVSNTRGIDIYKLKVNGKDVIVRDTDGLFQILDAEDVDFRHDIITNIIKESCSHLIVMLGVMTTHDRPLLDDIFDLILNSNTIGGVTICHNVKSITSVELLRDYAKHLCKCFEIKFDESNLCARQEIKMNNRTIIVNHIFLCDVFEAEPSHQMEQIKQLKALVSAGANESKSNLKSVLHNSICSTLIQKCENADEKQLSFTDLNRIKYDGTLKRKHGTVVRNVFNRTIEVRKFLAATKDHEIIKNKIHIEIGTPIKLTSEGWSLSSIIDDISKNLKLGIHVGIIGSFKIGKSTIIGWLSDEPLKLGDEVNNTRGIDIYKLKVNGTDVFVRDTEGLFQILGINDPYFRQDIITNILKESCSHLIVVFDLITTQDRPLLDKIISLILNSSNVDRVTICHNVKSIKSVNRLKEYAINLCECIDIGLDEKTLCAKQEVEMKNSSKSITKIVNHIFLCDFEAEPEHNIAQIKRLKTLVSGTTQMKVDFKKCLHTSISSTLIKRFEKAKKNHLTFTNLGTIKYEGGPLERKHGAVGDPLNRAIEVRPFIAPAEENDDETSLCKLRIIIDSGGIHFDTVKVLVVHDTQLQIDVEKYNEHTGEFKKISEFIDLPVGINRYVHPETVDTVAISEHNNIYFDVTLNCLRRYIDKLEEMMELSHYA